MFVALLLISDSAVTILSLSGSAAPIQLNAELRSRKRKDLTRQSSSAPAIPPRVRAGCHHLDGAAGESHKHMRLRPPPSDIAESADRMDCTKYFRARGETAITDRCKVGCAAVLPPGRRPKTDPASRRTPPGRIPAFALPTCGRCRRRMHTVRRAVRTARRSMQPAAAINPDPDVPIRWIAPFATADRRRKDPGR
jgi:hypothetical protein